MEVSGQNVDRNEETTCFQWKTKEESRLIKGEAKEITVTASEQITDKLESLIDTFCQEMPRFKIHIYNITNQLNHYRALKENLKKTEALIHIDFSENFQCKLSKEIQGMHFGASQRQITLHTGMYYTEQNFKPFMLYQILCNSGIWAFLDPLLDKLLDQHPDVETIHFFSNGPCTQYRQKGNCFLIITGDV